VSNIDIFVWEFLGTTVLCLLGNGSVAAVVLKNSYSHGTGGDWLIIVLGWGFGVFAGASLASPSGGHINPAVTLAVAISGGIPWSSVPVYWAAQLLGGIVGAVLCWAAFKLQFDKMDDNSGTRGIFATSPFVRRFRWNIVTEIIGTFVLVIWVLKNPHMNEALGYAGVAFVVITIGFALGGPTGYAINPARDLGPRIMHALLPIPGKRDSDWGYAWVPAVGPIVGASLAALLYRAVA
jgi:glycerol uptake facilitator protein